MKQDLFRDKNLQSQKDNELVSKLREYLDNSPGDNLVKFDNFSKYAPRNALSRFLARYEIFKLQLDVPGSVIELGVARGAGLMTWAQMSSMFEPVNYTREIVGFDTFGGFPEVSDKEKKSNSHLVKEGGLDVEDGMLEDVENAISVFDTNRPLGHIPKVKVFKGDIKETLPKYLEDNPHLVVSLLNLDADLYDPTRLGIELLFKRIPKGGIVIFDELHTKQFPGETIALIETLGIDSLKLKRFLGLLPLLMR